MFVSNGFRLSTQGPGCTLADGFIYHIVSWLLCTLLKELLYYGISAITLI
jgi:hypothetical protein